MLFITLSIREKGGRKLEITKREDGHGSTNQRMIDTDTSGTRRISGRAMTLSGSQTGTLETGTLSFST